MIQTKLLLMEYAAVNNPAQNPEKLNAIRELKNLLIQIDFRAEIVPMENALKLKDLLASLKGKPLSNCEIMIIEELIAF